MTAQQLIFDLSLKGVKFEVEGEGFRIRAPQGLISEQMREELASAKSEIITLLRQTDTEIQASHIAGDCPHCKVPLLVFKYPLDDEISVQCPSRSNLFKIFKQDAREWCRDCGERLNVIAGRCVECIQRLMLAPDEPCFACGGLRFWRYRATREKVAGFGWYCINCKEPSGKVAVYEVTL